MKASTQKWQEGIGVALTVEYGEPDNTGTRTLVTIRIGGRDIGDILIAEGLARSWPNGAEWWCSQ